MLVNNFFLPRRVEEMSPITMSADLFFNLDRSKKNNKQESEQDLMLRLKFFG